VKGLLAHVVALLLGAAVGLASVAVHRRTLLGLPAGLALALATTFVVAWALRQSWRPRLTTSYGAGWLVVFGIAVVGRPEGDYALANDFDGYTLVGAGFVVLVVSLTSLAARPPAQRDRPK
jgi:Family of unknown function (DUF6113)